MHYCDQCPKELIVKNGQQKHIFPLSNMQVVYTCLDSVQILTAKIANRRNRKILNGHSLNIKMLYEPQLGVQDTICKKDGRQLINN